MSRSGLGEQLFLEDAAHHDVLLALDPRGQRLPGPACGRAGRSQSARISRSPSTCPLTARKEFFVTLPSPIVDARANAKPWPAAIMHDARTRTLEFWSSYLAEGAQFEVPEKAVNDLFRANLWHALMLPRIHSDGHMDLPYSDFAYSQTGTPWPVNQAVYVDYMLYGLRGYNQVATR